MAILTLHLDYKTNCCEAQFLQIHLGFLLLLQDGACSNTDLMVQDGYGEIAVIHQQLLLILFQGYAIQPPEPIKFFVYGNNGQLFEVFTLKDAVKRSLGLDSSWLS